MKRAATALLLGLLLGSGGVLAQPAAAKTGQVTVDIVGLHSAEGRVFVAFWCGEAGFPGEQTKACASKVVNAQKGRLRVVFEAVRAGEFAVSMIHDENSNNKLDQNFLGIPKEGWGTSRDAKASFGPPSYSDARLSLSAGEKKQVVVHVQY
jgi:uncharacterized protein (DUF2141 family)